MEYLVFSRPPGEGSLSQKFIVYKGRKKMNTNSYKKRQKREQPGRLKKEVSLDGGEASWRWRDLSRALKKGVF